MIKRACGRGCMEQRSARQAYVKPKTRNRGREVAKQARGGRCRMRFVERILRQTREKQRRLEPLGLRPEARIRIVHAEIVVQRVDDQAVSKTALLGERAQKPGGREQRTPMERATAHEQPRPFELMPGLDQAMAGVADRSPIEVESLADCAGACTAEALEHDAHEAPHPVRPSGVLTGLRPGKTGLEEMHVWIRLEVSRVLARAKSAIAGCEALLDQRPQLECTRLEVSSASEHPRAALEPQQCECLIVEQGALLDRCPIICHHGAIQAVLPPVPLLEPVPTALDDHRYVAMPSEPRSKRERIYLTRMHAGAPRPCEAGPVLRDRLDETPGSIDAVRGPAWVGALDEPAQQLLAATRERGARLIHRRGNHPCAHALNNAKRVGRSRSLKGRMAAPTAGASSDVSARSTGAMAGICAANGAMRSFRAWASASTKGAGSRPPMRIASGLIRQLTARKASRSASVDSRIHASTMRCASGASFMRPPGLATRKPQAARRA